MELSVVLSSTLSLHVEASLKPSLQIYSSKTKAAKVCLFNENKVRGRCAGNFLLNHRPKMLFNEAHSAKV